MLKKISLVFEYFGVFEIAQAYVYNDDYNHAAYLYEGAVHFCEIIPTHDERLYAQVDAVMLGEFLYDEKYISEFFAKITGMSAYEFLLTFLFDPEMMEFNFIRKDDEDDSA